MHMLLCMHNIYFGRKMNRTTIMLPITLKMQVMSIAKSEGLSLGGLIRNLLETKLLTMKQSKGKKPDAFYAFNKVFSGSTPSDLAKNHDDYLYE